MRGLFGARRHGQQYSAISGWQETLPALCFLMILRRFHDWGSPCSDIVQPNQSETLDPETPQTLNPHCCERGRREFYHAAHHQQPETLNLPSPYKPKVQSP